MRISRSAKRAVQGEIRVALVADEEGGDEGNFLSVIPTTDRL